jgi:hypothetical protein
LRHIENDETWPAISIVFAAKVDRLATRPIDDQVTSCQRLLYVAIPPPMLENDQDFRISRVEGVIPRRAASLQTPPPKSGTHPIA